MIEYYLKFSTDHLETGKICEHHVANLNCRCGTIYVTSAIYGTTPTNPCSEEIRYCRDLFPFVAAATRVTKRCQNQKTCSVEASNDVFFDPCKGTTKYLHVSYDCVGEGNMPQNCKEVDCDSSNNIRCSKCIDNEFFKLVTGTCQRKCSWKNRWCWPGKCEGDLASGCTCSSGFRTVKDSTSARCQLSLLNRPSIDSCLTRAISSNGTKVLSLTGTSITNKCSLQNDFYGRFQVQHMQVDLTSTFNVTIPEYIKSARPKFVSEELFGVTDVYLDIHKVSVSGHQVHIDRKVMKDSSSHPVTKYKVDKVNISVTDKLNNGESCVNGSCSKEPLQISSRLTKSRYIKVSFSDWFDPHPEHGITSLASGIESYELSIHEVSESTPNVLMRDTRRIPQPHNRTKYQKEMAIVLPQKNPVLYAILLEVKDRADNVRQARRFVLYDNTSVVTKMTAFHSELIQRQIIRNGKNTMTVFVILGKIDFKTLNMLKTTLSDQSWQTHIHQFKEFMTKLMEFYQQLEQKMSTV
ncbi:unnamed protein product [Mytilus coruscus]|uniref:SUEL-type lectin domain-containing protein n=1 Tax=Mytilus coruscus TaxID=42192 RepID=A0A6J8CRQ1_MYTCO|nr:unnamed protein product [Mytilus coruscus]